MLATAKAGRIEPVSLIRPILEWYADIYQGGNPDFYGRGLARVGCFADFAVWIPWMEKAEA